jgi:hypothetical protein
MCRVPLFGFDQQHTFNLNESCVPELALPAKNERPSRTLVLTIFDDMPRLDCLVFYKICAPFGEVRPIQVTVHTRPDILCTGGGYYVLYAALLISKLF